MNTKFSLRHNRFIAATLCALLALIMIASPVLAEEDPPPDPGVGGGQDYDKSDSIRWVLPHGSIITFSTGEVDITLDWSTVGLYVTSDVSTGSAGHVHFIGVGVNPDDVEDCDEAGNSGKCKPGKPKTGCSDDVWITPGGIQLVAIKAAPANPLVYNQDPDKTGVRLEWVITIEPTTLNYEKMKLVGHRFIRCDACKNPKKCEDDPDYDPDSGFTCPQGNKPIIEHIWACVVQQQYFKERVNEVKVGAQMQAASVSWIEGELARVYPGTYVRHPRWEFVASEPCVYDGNLCIITHIETKVPVDDPGRYDLYAEGYTSGTAISPPRSFRLVDGEFGVFLIDQSLTP